MLTQAQVTLVQNSFAVIAPIADDAAALFYRRLFEIDPGVRSMFKDDMSEQRRKLMQMLTAAVKGLSHLDRLIPVVEELGRRHTGYGVPMRTTRPSVRRCSGPWRRGSAKHLRHRRERPGRPSTARSPRR